jgi:hypothetical protein
MRVVANDLQCLSDAIRATGADPVERLADPAGGQMSDGAPKR